MQLREAVVRTRGAAPSFAAAGFSPSLSLVDDSTQGVEQERAAALAAVQFLSPPSPLLTELYQQQRQQQAAEEERQRVADVISLSLSLWMMTGV